MDKIVQNMLFVNVACMLITSIELYPFIPVLMNLTKF